jgi:hypothetical protein
VVARLKEDAIALEEAAMELQTEQAFFEKNRSQLLKEHRGKYALIKGEVLVGTFDTAENAYIAGVQRFGNVPFLIKQVVEEEREIYLPAMTLGLLRAV